MTEILADLKLLLLLASHYVQMNLLCWQVVSAGIAETAELVYEHRLMTVAKASAAQITEARQSML